MLLAVYLGLLPGGTLSEDLYIKMACGMNSYLGECIFQTECVLGIGLDKFHLSFI